MQFGPFAVAQLRLIAELQRADGDGQKRRQPSRLPELPDCSSPTRWAIPSSKKSSLARCCEPIAKSRREPTRSRRDQPITVVIGNPPYKEKARRARRLDRERRAKGARLPMDWWTPPVNGASARTPTSEEPLRLSSGAGRRGRSSAQVGYEATGEPKQTRHGIVCFITVAGFLNGPGFQKMRDDLRRDCSDIWVIDCSPEGHQPDVPTRIFQGVQQPVCIVLAAREAGKDNGHAGTRALLHRLPEGKRRK